MITLPDRQRLYTLSKQIKRLARIEREIVCAEQSDAERGISVASFVLGFALFFIKKAISPLKAY